MSEHASLGRGATVGAALLSLVACGGPTPAAEPSVIVTPDALALDLWSASVSRCRELASMLPHAGNSHRPDVMFTAHYAYVEAYPRCVEGVEASDLDADARALTAATLDIVLAQAHHLGADAAYLEGDIPRVCEALAEVRQAATQAHARLADVTVDATGATERMAPAIRYELWFADTAGAALCPAGGAP